MSINSAAVLPWLNKMSKDTQILPDGSHLSLPHERRNRKLTKLKLRKTVITKILNPETPVSRRLTRYATSAKLFIRFTLTINLEMERRVTVAVMNLYMEFLARAVVLVPRQGRKSRRGHNVDATTSSLAPLPMTTAPPRQQQHQQQHS